jgi:ElaB/YqjD/DUF883 family membrane-anchored ribosome-binding protein
MSSTTDPGDKSSAQIESEVAGTRARLADTLDTLRERLSPGELIDQAVQYVRGSAGTDLARNVAQSAKDNPVPFILIGAGAGWLIYSWVRDSSRSGAASSPHSNSSPGPSRGSEGVAGRMRESVGSAYDAMESKAGSVMDDLSSTKDTALQKTGQMAQSIRDQAPPAVSGLLDHPFVIAAAGVAIGAALGALLPATETESRLMGEASDALKQNVSAAAKQGVERAQEMAAQQLDQAKSAFGETYEKSKEQLDQAGLSPAKLGATVGSVAEGVQKRR